jgi:hypothetical protein
MRAGTRLGQASPSRLRTLLREVIVPTNDPRSSATAGVTMGSTTVDLKAVPEPDGTVRCALSCNNQRVIIRFLPDGSIDTDVEPSSA